MTLNKAILATLIYHDLFDYPLAIDEIQKYLISRYASIKSIDSALKNLLSSKKVSRKGDYYFLFKRDLINKTRITRHRYSQRKLKRARFYSQILKIIPSIKLLAVTGALAMENSTKGDDIDFMIVTAKNSLWTTRLLATLSLILFKRNPNSSRKANRACLNIFIEEEDLKITDQNLYTAHEVIQVNVLWDRDNTYLKFIRANNWVSKYLPNWKPEIVKQQYSNSDRKQKKAFRFSPLALVAELYFKKIQLTYMHSKITSEKIGESQLFFHPKATQSDILKKYNQKLKKIKIS